jgi:hypothetical protein
MLGAPTGGGAGGSIVVISPQLSVDSAFVDPETGSSFLFSARGGIGSPDLALASSPTVLGGGGGGGLVLFQADGVDEATLAALTDSPGGLHPDFATTCAAVHAGEPGMTLVESSPATCLDLDGDGAEASSCGGPDCNDGNPDQSPGAQELCDGVDNDCSGVADDEPEGGIAEGDPRCGLGSGQHCVDGACVSDPPSDGGSAPVTPSSESEGGCSLTSSRAAGGTVGGALAGTLGLLVLARRARRSRCRFDRPDR